MNYKEYDEGSVCSQPTASQTGENFHQKKMFTRTKNIQRCLNCEEKEIQLKQTLEQVQKIEDILLTFQQQIEDQNIEYQRQQQKQEELILELQILEEKNHQEQLNNGILSKQNMELRKNVLKLEQDILQFKHQNQESQNKKTSDIKFIQSLALMFQSFHTNIQEPTLKQIWKWLKFIVSEYVLLKQKEITNKK